MRIPLQLMCLVCAVVAGWTSSASASADPERMKLTEAYGVAGAQKILSSADRVLDAKPKATDAPNGIALHCFAAAELMPYFGERALAAVSEDANVLASISGASGGEVGWSIAPGKTDSCGVPGEQNILHRGCNPVGTAYTFRTALALTCVGRAFLLTRDPKLLDVAKRAVASSWPHGTATPGCASCFYYWMSYSPLDTGRYVRNINVLMGMALGTVYSATKDPRILDRIRKIANAEQMEISAGNKGYFSIVDPQYKANPQRESTRIENHVPYVAKGLLEIGNVLDDQRLIADAAKIEASWSDCSDAICGGSTCKHWGADPARCDIKQQASVCFFRKTSAEFADKCRAFVLSEKELDAYEIWAALSDL
jgi:hypothetical protein